jgi:hypothetical protein
VDDCGQARLRGRFGTNGPHVLLHRGVATVEACDPEFLEDALGGDSG